MNLMEEDQEHIRSFFFQTRHAKSKQEEFHQFLNQLAPSYRLKIQDILFTTALIANQTI